MNTNPKFFLYARKSTDEADRQILSIEAQLEELRQLARKQGITIAGEFVESRTAKEPGRPLFNQMLEKIEKGKAQGILAWHPDRLARNSVDGGRIIYLVDTGKIAALQFSTFWFEPTPQGKFMLNIAFGQSKYFVDNLSENTKRGLRQKLRRGEWPSLAPLGYRNDLKTHTVVIDPDRAPLIRRLFELYATGDYSLQSLQKLLTDAGLLSRKGNEYSFSNVHNVITNPFYYGVFKFTGEHYQGSHEPLITKELFDRVQQVLHSKSRPRGRSAKEYAFRGVFMCGECGCAITAETQKGHNYYRCTKKRIACSQKYIREEVLAQHVSTLLQKIALPEEWADEMLKELEREAKSGAESRTAHVQNLQSEIKQCDERLEALLDAHLDKVLSREEYLLKKEKVLNQKVEFSQKLNEIGSGGENRLEPIKEFILAAKNAASVAANENLSEKKNFLKNVGSNQTLRHREVTVSPRDVWKTLWKWGFDESAPLTRSAFWTDQTGGIPIWLQR